jgi:hypothetical protein
MVLLTILHLCNGAANIKKNLGNKVLVPSVSFPSPTGGTVLVPPLVMVQTHAPNKKICQFYDCNGAALLAAPFTLAVMYCLSFLVCTVLAHFFKFIITFVSSPHEK